MTDSMAINYASEGYSVYTEHSDILRNDAFNAIDLTQKEGSRHHALAHKGSLNNDTKSKHRSKIAHIFSIISDQSGFKKVRHLGLV